MRHAAIISLPLPHYGISGSVLSYSFHIDGSTPAQTKGDAMQFESQKKRNILFLVALGLIPDTLISIAIAWLSGEGVPIFFASLLGLQVLYFALWTKNSIWAWIYFQLRGREQAVKHMTNYLWQNDYPEPKDYEKSVESYLVDIVADDDQPTELRIKAGGSLAELEFMRARGLFQDLLRITMAYEAALENHKRTFSRA